MRVSIVMAGRNSNPAFLKEAIDSVLNQSFQDFEFIFVDDGSDNPMEPVVHSISNDARISIYRIEPSGLGAALNYGIKKAKGEYIARLDDDDLMLPTRLEKQFAFLNTNADVSCVGSFFYDMVGQKCYPHRKYPINNEEIIKGLLSLHWGLAHTAVMFRKTSFDTIGGYRIPGGGQDLDLFLQLGTTGKLANVDEYLTCYRMSETGLGSVNPKKKEAYLFALENVVNRDLYHENRDITLLSINKLKEGMQSPKKKRKTRKLLVWRVKLFGKKLKTVL